MTALLYAIITLGNATLTGVMSGWLIYFYLPPDGVALVPLALFGIVVLISRVSHVAASLLVNRFAPRTASRWLWYLVGGALLMPVLFAFLWLPPQDKESSANLLHLFFVLVAFSVASGIHQAGYEALLPVVAIDESARGAISNWRMVFLLGGSILSGLVGPLIQMFSYNQTIWMFVVGSAPFLIVPGILLRRRLGDESQLPEHIPFLENVKTAWGSHAFRAFASSWALMWLATTFTFETLPYIATEICRLSVSETAYFYFTIIIVSIAAYPAVSKLTERYGVKAVYRASLFAGAVAAFGLVLINEHIPIPLMAQGLLWVALQTACLTGAQSIPGAIVAEITADDPQQQGPLYAFGNLVDQLASGLALALIPFFMILGRSLADPLGPLGIRLLAPAGSIFLLAAFYVFGRYKINQFSKLN